MHWWYCQPYPQPTMLYVYPIMPQPQEVEASISLSSTQKKDQEKKQKNVYFSDQAKEKLIILTRQDLQVAGYEIDKKLWTEEEDKILKEQMKKKKMNWTLIAKKLPGRNPKMCYNRYRRIESSTKKCWTSKQNRIILQMVNSIGEDWNLISQSLKGRSSKQAKDHYYQYLIPSLNRSPWNLDEDLKLIQLINLHGYDWKVLGSIFPNRCQFQIKNRYFGKIKKLNQKKLQSIKSSGKKTIIKEQF